MMSELTCFAVLWQIAIALTVVVRLSLILPVLTAIICVSFTVVVYNKVVLVESVPHDFLVAFFVNSLVQILRFLDLVCVEGRFARGTQSTDLCERRSPLLGF